MVVDKKDGTKRQIFYNFRYKKWLLANSTERDKKKTAFTSHSHLYKYNVMSFGLVNAPGIFKELMSIVWHGLGNLLYFIWMTK